MSRVPQRLRWAAGVAAIAFVAGLFVGGAQPVAVGLIPAPWDKLVHLAAFGGLTVLVGLALDPPVWALAALPLLVSAADELHQATLPGRAAGLDDWLAGAVGVALAVWLLRRPRLPWLPQVAVGDVDNP
jgi:VanZ family protein